MLVSLPPPVTPCFFSTKSFFCNFDQTQLPKVHKSSTKPNCPNFIYISAEAPLPLPASKTKATPRRGRGTPLAEEMQCWLHRAQGALGGVLLKVNGSPPRLARRGMPCLHGSSCFYCAHIPVDMQGSEPEGTPFARPWRGWLCWWAQQSEIQPGGKGEKLKGLKTSAGLSSLPAVLMSCR